MSFNEFSRPSEELKLKVKATEEMRETVVNFFGENNVQAILLRYKLLFTQARTLESLRKENKNLQQELKKRSSFVSSLTRAIKQVHLNVEAVRLMAGDALDETIRLREDLLNKSRWYHKLMFWKK